MKPKALKPEPKLKPPRGMVKKIIRLAGKAAMLPDKVYEMVINNGLEATEMQLEEQINLISAVMNPEPEAPPVVEPEPPTEEDNADVLEQAQIAEQLSSFEPKVPILNGHSVEKSLGIGAGPDNAGERRNEPTESGKGDFINSLVTGQDRPINELEPQPVSD